MLAILISTLAVVALAVWLFGAARDQDKRARETVLRTGRSGPSGGTEEERLMAASDKVLARWLGTPNTRCYLEPKDDLRDDFGIVGADIADLGLEIAAEADIHISRLNPSEVRTVGDLVNVLLRKEAGNQACRRD